MSQTKLSAFFAAGSEGSRKGRSVSHEPQQRNRDTISRRSDGRGYDEGTNRHSIINSSGASNSSSSSSLTKLARSTSRIGASSKKLKPSKSSTSRAKHPRPNKATSDRMKRSTMQQPKKTSNIPMRQSTKDPVRLNHERILSSLAEEFGIPVRKSATSSSQSKKNPRQQQSRTQKGGSHIANRAKSSSQRQKKKSVANTEARSIAQSKQNHTQEGFRLASGRPLPQQPSLSQENMNNGRREAAETNTNTQVHSLLTSAVQSMDLNPSVEKHDESSQNHRQPRTGESTKVDDSTTEKRTASEPRSDFQSQDRKKPKTKNTFGTRGKDNSTMDWIYRRSITGMRNQLSLPKRICIPWKATPWLYLQNISDASSIRHMCWDNEGVLFAVLSAQTLIIYDWDSVTAADRKGRNAHARKKALKGEIQQMSSCFCVAPTLSIRLPSSFSASSSNLGCLSVHWNPHNPDEIALLHLNGNVCIYDLGSVLAWQDTQRDSMAQSWSSSTRTPHKSIRLDQSMTGHTIGHLLFVSSSHLIVTMGDEVACYAVPKNESVAKKLLWKWKWQTITSIIAVSSRQVLLGSKNGCMSLVDWRRSQKPAFASKPIPTVVAQWSTTAAFRKSSLPDHVGGMGIIDLQNQSSKSCNAGELCPRVLQMSWRTPSGWVLSARLDSCDLKLTHTLVVKSTARVKVLNHRGEETNIDSAKMKWSLPVDGKMVGCGTSNSLVWTKVPKVTQILPHHDHRVMVSSTQAGQVQRETIPPTLLFYNRSSGQMQEITLSTKSKSWPNVVAIHPSQEWLVVVDDGGCIRILNARGR